MASLEVVSGDEVSSQVSGAGVRGVLARGLGRSYGDAAQNGGGVVLRLDQSLSEVLLDETAGTAVVPAGVSIDELLRLIVPRGWFVPVTPGTRFVTIGGAIASDVHGKNHHVDGTFGSHVERMSMVLADGALHMVDPSMPLFWATVGGMGLTGVIVDATIRLLRIETSLMSVDTHRLVDLDALLSAMADGDDSYRYSVAWIDLMARGSALGRSVLTRADHAAAAAVPNATEPLRYGPRQLVTVPPVVPRGGVLTRSTVSVFNEMWFRKTPRHRIGELQSIPSFFHPLDAVGDWNRLYGRRGMVQYQFVVPFGQETTLTRVVERFAESRIACFLAVLKRFGPESRAPLSFPQRGWTLALDVPAAAGGVSSLFVEFDRLVLDAGGRHYFAKDGCTTAAAVRRGYPRLDEWREIRQRVDPLNRFQSDLGRRLELIDRAGGADG